MKLIKKEEVADGTFAFLFERPRRFEFIPGQFVEVTLEEASPTDPFRSFSIASAPCEEHLMIATRIRDSAFKQALSSMAPGAEVQIDGPYGRFGLRGDAGCHVLISGGIGVTPFRSIVVQAANERTRGSMVLFHANRDLEGAPFHQEMTGLSAGGFGFQFVPTVTRPSEGWLGETGYVDASMLSRYLDLSSAMYYISGPEAMVKSTRDMLLKIPVASDRIVTEAFEGY
jgi:ferredoxin-NADP reductase